MTTKSSCCEVCDRNPTCGVDCGSCDGINWEEAVKDWQVPPEPEAKVRAERDQFRAEIAALENATSMQRDRAKRAEAEVEEREKSMALAHKHGAMTENVRRLADALGLRDGKHTADSIARITIERLELTRTLIAALLERAERAEAEVEAYKNIIFSVVTDMRERANVADTVHDTGTAEMLRYFARELEEKPAQHEEPWSKSTTCEGRRLRDAIIERDRLRTELAVLREERAAWKTLRERAEAEVERLRRFPGGWPRPVFMGISDDLSLTVEWRLGEDDESRSVTFFWYPDSGGGCICTVKGSRQECAFAEEGDADRVLPLLQEWLGDPRQAHPSGDPAKTGAPERPDGYVVAGSPVEELRALQDTLTKSASIRTRELERRGRKGQESAEVFAEQEVASILRP